MRSPSTVDGVIVVDKPQGLTSHDVVASLRRVLRQPKVGHAGTLDPMATGVLPLLVGRATRLSRFLLGGRKRYLASVRLGVSTDTYDRTGRPVSAGPSAAVEPPRGLDTWPIPDVGLADLERALAAFLGTGLQQPPPFSAKHVEGVRAYRLARATLPVKLPGSTVTLYALTLAGYEDGVVTLDLECSAGYYVRSLAHALGERLGCGGHLAALRRTMSGGFGVQDAVPLDVLLARVDEIGTRLVTMQDALWWLPAIPLTAADVERVGHGQAVESGSVAPVAAGSRLGDAAEACVRLVGPDGALVALARHGPEPGVLHPFTVLV